MYFPSVCITQNRKVKSICAGCMYLAEIRRLRGVTCTGYATEDGTEMSAGYCTRMSLALNLVKPSPTLCPSLCPALLDLFNRLIMDGGSSQLIPKSEDPSSPGNFWLITLAELCLFKQGICPRLSWPLIIEVCPITWLECELQPTETKFLKKWAAPARSSNTSIIFPPDKEGGLALPSTVSLQATKIVQLPTFHDPEGSRSSFSKRESQTEVEI